MTRSLTGPDGRSAFLALATVAAVAVALMPAAAIPATAGPAFLVSAGTLYHNFLNSSGWQGWEPYFDGAPSVSQVAVSKSPWGSLEAFVVGDPNGTVYRNYLNSSGWHGW